jgi:hypothetical protein
MPQANENPGVGAPRLLESASFEKANDFQIAVQVAGAQAKNELRSDEVHNSASLSSPGGGNDSPLANFKGGRDDSAASLAI